MNDPGRDDGRSTRWAMLLLCLAVVGGIVGVVAMLHAGRPATHYKVIWHWMVPWAALPYLVAFALSVDLGPGWAFLTAILAPAIGPVLLFNAERWFGIDTRYDPRFLAVPLVQIVCCLPFRVLGRKAPPEP